MSGLIIAQRFKIGDPVKDLLGRGGMGEVYRATDIQTGETVAVKALDPQVVARDPAMLERFVREGEALRQLNHPNIVRMIATVEEQGQHYLIVEYVSGGSLADVLAAQERLPSSRVIELALDLADALTRAHRLGIIHRDLKPANVLLAHDGTPRLADFGIAHVESDQRLTQTGVLMGTIDYLSPEVCQGKPPNERSDIWAFGVMLFEMLTGRVPFEGKSLTAKLTAILTQPVPDLAQLAPDIPEALADLVYRMLDKDHQQRIPSVRLVGAELEAMLKGWHVIPPSRLTSAESRFATPTLAANAHAPRHNLPVQTTPFVGREAELRELARLLADPSVRLLTIVGVGGMGKTRLALQAGCAQLDNYQDGIYLISLAPLQSVDAIVPTIAHTLDFSFHERGEPRLQLLDYLWEKNLLLIMDNFEHLLGGIGLVNDIIQSAPRVKVLSTSRSRLNVQGEQLFHLSGMDFPDWETPEDALEYSAVKLFLQSARRVRPGFDLGAGDLKYISRICRLVGGMPLGILLAAAWVGMLSPAEIADEIGQSLDLLETDLRDVPERQRSMRAILGHSWNLLAEREQRVFQALSVFRGGFTRQAVQQVTGGSLRDLMGLADKSLLQRAPTGRYEVHELLRQYAAQKLQASGDADALRQRHLEYYLSLAEAAQPELRGRDQVHWLQSLAAENDNFRAALAWSLDSGRAQIGVRLAVCLDTYWHNSRLYQESRSWLERLLAAAPQPTMDRFRALENLAYVVHNLGDYALTRAVAEEALALAKALGDPKAVADATFVLSWPHFSMGDTARSRQLMEQSLALYRDLGELRQAAFAVAMLGEVARATGDWASARELDEQAVEWHRSLDDRRRLAVAVGNLGNVLIHFGELDRSQSLLWECLAIFAEMDMEVAFPLQSLAFLASAKGQPVRAARLLGADAALRKTTGRAIDPGDRPDYERTLSSVRSHLGDAAFATAWAEGQALTEEQAIALALSDEP